MRRAVAFVVSFAWCALLFAALAPLAIAWPTLAWRNRLSLIGGRWWSAVTLALAGVRVRYRGREQLRHPAILTFNHTSILDFFVNASLAGSRCLVFGKRELSRVPLVGWAWLLGGHPLIRRDDREHWQREVDRVERLLRERGFSTCVAPEGRRSPDGTLLPFKKGPFHLAVATGLPIVPVVIQGGPALMRGGGPRPGQLDVQVLPALDTSGWREETLDEHMAELRAVYEAALSAPPG